MHRGSFQIGRSITLRAVFTDVGGDFIDADDPPIVYIYDESVDDSVREAEVEAETFTSATATITAVSLGTGYYEADYALNTQEGLVYEYWYAEIDGASQVATFTWTATAGAQVTSQTPGNNTMVIIDINGIKDVDGNELEERLFFTTMYVPMYASPDLLRLELGAWISYITDDTLALMIHLSSLEADFVQARMGCNPQRAQMARTRFVIYDAALRAMMIPGHGMTATQASGGGSKALGDLKISTGSMVSSKDVSDVAGRLKDERDKWLRVLMAGGCVNPGQGYSPTYAVKGARDPDRRQTGRLWEDPREFGFIDPAVNRKEVTGGRRRARFGLYPVPVRGGGGTNTSGTD